jgi:hypothetical protein
MGLGVQGLLSGRTQGAARSPPSGMLDAASQPMGQTRSRALKNKKKKLLT